MAFSWTWTNNLDEDLMPGWGDEVHGAIKQLADDLYITPTNSGSKILTYPLQTLAPIFTSHATGNGTTGVTVSLPAGYTPASVDDYEVVGLSYQGDPGGNGNIWAEKGLSNFVIKHYGSKTGVKIAYSIVRKTA